jgi:Kef-type K+ transport system membrane component KefB
MTTNTILTFAVIVLLMTVGFVLTVPDVPVVPMVGVVGVLAPLVFFPVSYLLWWVFDLVARPPEPAELLEAQNFAESA